MAKEIFIITDKDGLPIFWRNSHDFKDPEGLAPAVGEVMLSVFTSAVYAVRYIYSRNDPRLNCYLVDSQKKFDFLKKVSTDEGHKRLCLNCCILNNEKHERIIPMLEFDKINYDFEPLVDMFNKIEVCDFCYNKQKILAELGPDTTTKILYSK